MEVVQTEILDRSLRGLRYPLLPRQHINVHDMTT